LPRKLILCRCEDVTLADVERAIAAGYSDLEEVKRHTGFGTGPCQGKECLRAVAVAVADAVAAAAAAGAVPSPERDGSARLAHPFTLRPFTSRPPLAPTELKWFARPPGRKADP
jgi:sarcosine oxidase subunit beta